MSAKRLKLAVGAITLALFALALAAGLVKAGSLTFLDHDGQENGNDNS